jgi:hypothetical protein
MAADTSSWAAATTAVVRTAAAALAEFSVEPMFATSVAATETTSGAATTYDISNLLGEASQSGSGWIRDQRCTRHGREPE